jgi:hypothetical protein
MVLYSGVTKEKKVSTPSLSKTGWGSCLTSLSVLGLVAILSSRIQCDLIIIVVAAVVIF